jgi:chromosomal replication initiator protein
MIQLPHHLAAHLGSGNTRRVHESLIRRVGPSRHGLWFVDSATLAVTERRLCVHASSRFAAEWIERHFHVHLRAAADEVLGTEAVIDISIAATGSVPTMARTSMNEPCTDAPRLRLANATASPAHDHTSQKQPRAPQSGAGRRAAWKRFDDFLVCSGNRLAFDSAVRMAERTSGAPQMLFLHGACGVGKTHLCEALCRRFVECTPGARIRYVTGEQFTNEFIAAVRDGSIEAIRRRQRRYELLVIDDVHFLGNKNATQSECLHTLDAIAAGGGRIVLASDAHPRAIGRCSPALVSRLLASLVVQVEPLDRLGRITLTKRRLATRGLDLVPSALEALVDRSGTSIRELEGAVLAVCAHRASLGMESECGHVLVERALGHAEPLRAGRPVRLSDIITAVCAETGVATSELLGIGRHRRVATARGLAALLARELTTSSFPEIAAALGRSSHSAVHAAVTKYRASVAGRKQVDVVGHRIGADALVERTRRSILAFRS